MNGKKIEKLIKDIGMPLNDFASEFGLHRQNVSRYFKKEDFAISDLIKICKILNVPLSALLDKNDLEILKIGDASKTHETEKSEIELEAIKKEKDYLERENALLRQMIEILRKDQETQNEEKKTSERAKTRANTPQFQPQKR